MRPLLSLFLSLLALNLAGQPQRPSSAPSSSASSKSILETVEWTWAARPEAVDPALPNVLLFGDSITRAYYPGAVKLLAGRANCYLFATSAGSGDPRLIAQVKDYFAMEPLHFAAIHFNNGMHGWKYDEAAYSEALPALVKALQVSDPQAALIWTSTTPVKTATPGGASNPRIDERNAAAAAVMQRFRIVVDDQHALMLQHDALHSDSVHYTSAGSDLEAQQVAQMIANTIALPPTAAHGSAAPER